MDQLVGENPAVGTPVGEAFRALAARWNRDHYQIATLAAAVAESDVWARENSPTAAHWLAKVAGVEQSTARSWIATGKALRTLNATAVAFEAGEISFTAVRTLARHATVDTEQALLEIARTTTADELADAIATWRTQNSDPEELAEYQHAQRSLTKRLEPDGMTRYAVRLPPDVAGRLNATLAGIVTRSRPEPEPDGRPPTLAQQYADALDILLTSGAGTTITELIVHVRGDGNTFDDGTPIANSLIERLAPEAFWRVMIHNADRVPINTGSRRRHPSTRQQRIVKERDRRCVDCGTTRLLEYDHNPPYQLTRHTLVEELELRCALCHRKRHQPTSAA